MHRAVRGVCIGVDRNLSPGDLVPDDLTAAEVQFLTSIGAIEKVEPPPAAPAEAPAPTPEAKAPAKPGKEK
jgi:hypothetical protein